MLLNHGADLNTVTSDGKSLIHVCAEEDSIVPLAYFRHIGANMNLRDSQKKTALQYAIENNSRCALKYMLNWEGIDYNTQDINGETPLHYIVRYADSLDMRHLNNLLFRGADRNVKNNYGQTPRDIIT